MPPRSTSKASPIAGTLIRLVLPILEAEELGGSVVGAIYEERSSKG